MIDCKYHMKECLLGKQEFGKAVLLWLSRKKGKRESSSGSGEEREGEMVCSAPVRRGVKEDRKEGRKERGVIRGKAHCIAETKAMWQVGEELKKRRIRI